MSRKLTVEEFISKSKLIHGDKFQYSKFVYINNRTRGIIICPIHGEFQQTPMNHLSGNGCDECGGTLTSNTRKFISTANLIHCNAYDYSETNYINNHTKLTIICPIHGKFKQKPNDHLQGKGCATCYGNSRLTIHEFIVKSTEIHNGYYDYSRAVYVNNRSKLIIICPKHGSFLQKASDHMRGIGCGKCSLSKGEIKIESYLKMAKINYISQQVFDDCLSPKTHKHLKFDFFVPHKNLLIEYDGEQHFHCCKFNRGHHITGNELAETKYRDRIKTKYAKQHGIVLIRIPYTKMSKINDILRQALTIR
jgi:hypothetical protein